MTRRPASFGVVELALVISSAAIAIGIAIWRFVPPKGFAPAVEPDSAGSQAARSSSSLRWGYLPRDPVLDTSGFVDLNRMVSKWEPDATLQQISDV